jgi:hypothetical protein
MTRWVGVVSNLGIHPHGVDGNDSTRFLLLNTSSQDVQFRYGFHELQLVFHNEGHTVLG